MTVENYRVFTIVAGRTVVGTKGSGDINKAYAMDGLTAVNPTEAVGILQRAGINSGDHMPLAFDGLMNFTAAVSVGVGAQLTVQASGYMALAGSGDVVSGKAVDAVDSGEIGRGIFNFAGGGVQIIA